ncbi:MAG: hypothetical protein P4L56_12335 [Candidatus Sulfopaludibacter sp.]|nr:hypothetical protein [Candidatus Sulfopaludibacter sp.]
MAKLLRYIELKTGYEDNGPAWIGYVTTSRTGRTVYFNGHALGKGSSWEGGNYSENGNSYWVSGVKKNGKDRHWAGSGKVLIEAAAVAEYLKTIGATSLDKSRLAVTHSIVQTDIEKFERLANAGLR